MVGPSEIVTERLRLRPWRSSEADLLLEVRARPEVARWMAEPTPWTDRAQAEEVLARWATESDADPGLGAWALVPEEIGTPVGWVTLRRIPGGDGEVEIGWTLHPDAWGRGYAREAAQAVLAHGLALGLPRIWAVMWPGNAPSAAVCRAIGMDDLGVRPDPWYGGESHLFCIENT
jgi:RimJ/RimL family protein N-acetyltransferase